ncbi:hypothetical protein RPE78_06730 [Thioclava litoralis]|uniref:Ornithine cyclodeaminase n=1 Tax=Thioclava litoralis TaxID=3076557 RepID=A0ABZ1E1M4_9RHOB|nr:hypothetical protein RPE78_06730 [Thioclava sp. FTW29]
MIVEELRRAEPKDGTSWREADGLNYVRAEDIASILASSRGQIIDVVAETYDAFYHQEAINPDTYSLRFPQKANSRINALPSYIGRDIDLAGLKWVASFPDNVARNRQRASALIVVNSFETGYPLAVLDGTAISSARTVASAALAARRLVPSRETDELTFYGAGVINRDLLAYLQADGWRFDHVTICDPVSASAEAFSQHCTLRGMSAQIGEAPRRCDSGLMAFATSALEPWYDHPFHADQTVLHMSLRDVVPERLKAPVFNVVDDVNHALKANTSLHLLQQMQGHVENVANFAAIAPGARRPEGPVVVSAFGMGILDLAVAHFVLNAAQDRGTLCRIDGLLPEFSRW